MNDFGNGYIKPIDHLLIAQLLRITVRFPSFGLELGKGLFDGVEIGAVGGEIKQNMSVAFDKFLCLGGFMEGGVVHDDHAGLGELSEQALLQPGVEHGRIAGSGKQHRRQQGLAAFGQQQTGSWPALTAFSAVDPSPLQTPAVLSGRVRLKAGFIQIHRRITPAHITFA